MDVAFRPQRMSIIVKRTFVPFPVPTALVDGAFHALKHPHKLSFLVFLAEVFRQVNHLLSCAAEQHGSKGALGNAFPGVKIQRVIPIRPSCKCNIVRTPVVVGKLKSFLKVIPYRPLSLLVIVEDHPVQEFKIPGFLHIGIDGEDQPEMII